MIKLIPRPFSVYDVEHDAVHIGRIERRRSGASQWNVIMLGHRLTRQFPSLTVALQLLLEIHGIDGEDPRALVDAMMVARGKAAPRRRT